MAEGDFLQSGHISSRQYRSIKDA